MIIQKKLGSQIPLFQRLSPKRTTQHPANSLPNFPSRLEHDSNNTGDGGEDTASVQGEIRSAVGVGGWGAGGGGGAGLVVSVARVILNLVLIWGLGRGDVVGFGGGRGSGGLGRELGGEAAEDVLLADVRV